MQCNQLTYLLTNHSSYTSSHFHSISETKLYTYLDTYYYTQ